MKPQSINFESYKDEESETRNRIDTASFGLIKKHNNLNSEIEESKSFSYQKQTNILEEHKLSNIEQ